jgi:hypothetical protein
VRSERYAARVRPAEWLLLAALVAWAVVPPALMALHALAAHERFTGADGLIGAGGVLGADQLQYLAWTRDAGSHGLVSNLFSLQPSAHVFLAPLALLAAALWRLGLSLPLSYLLVKPFAAIALFAAALAWARRFIDGTGARAAAVALSLFLYTPAAELVNWVSLGSGRFRFQTYLLGWELLSANKLWGYAPSALAIALMPVVVLATERALEPPRGSSGLGPSAVAGGAALLAAWLHPWQGATLLVVLGGLALWQRGRGWRGLVLPAVGAAAPLVYYYVLSHTDAAWELASANEVVGRLPAVVLLAGLAPPALVAALGLRRPGEAIAERALLLWVAGTFATYFATDAFSSHALQGLSFPLAILMVRGWQRLGLPAAAGAVAIALITLPGMAWDAHKLRDSVGGSVPQYYLPAADARALDWVAAAAPPGGVLAPTPFAIVVPSQTGRAVWAGHPYWTRDYARRSRQLDALFTDRIRPGAARALVSSTGASLLISDCGHRSDLAGVLRPLLASVHRFGCATVYVVRRDGRSAGTRTAGPTTPRRSRTPCCPPARRPGHAGEPRPR